MSTYTERLSEVIGHLQTVVDAETLDLDLRMGLAGDLGALKALRNHLYAIERNRHVAQPFRKILNTLELSR